MRLATAALLALILSMWSANSAAAPVSYQIQPDSFVSQCPGFGSRAPCVAAPVSGILTLDVLESGEALLDTSDAPLINEGGSGQLDLAIAIWDGLGQLVGVPLPVGAPFDVWQFQGTIAGAPVDVGLQRLGQIEIFGGTAVTGGYIGPEVFIDVTAVPVPDPHAALLLLISMFLIVQRHLGRVTRIDRTAHVGWRIHGSR